jgi:hypothetical protein
VISAEAVASTVVGEPTEEAFDVIAPLVNTEPSEGYEKPAAAPEESFGAETYPCVTALWPGTRILTAKACAVARFRSGADEPVAGPSSRTDAPSASTARCGRRLVTGTPLWG